MDIDKAGRIHSYVHAQLAFVPFYGTDLLGPSDSLPEVFGLQTPVLKARNPLVTVQPESNPLSASVYLEGSRGGPTKEDPPPTKEPNENQKKLLAKNHLGAEELKRLLKVKGDTRVAPGPDSSSEFVKQHTPIKRERRSRREKPRLPTSLSFLYGFSPKNVGPSRLTIPTGDKGVFGRGKSSSTATGVFVPDLTARPVFHGEAKFTAIGSQLPSTPSNMGFDRSDFTHSGKQQHTPKPTGKIAEGTKPRVGRVGGTPDDASMTWDIELEDGTLPSDSSSFACDTTVVIDTGRIWDHQEGMQQSIQTVADHRDKPRPLATRSLDEYPRPTSRVTSRFFSSFMPGFDLREDKPTPRMPTHDWEDPPDREPELPTLDDHLQVDCPRPDVGWEDSSDQWIDSIGDYCETPLADITHEETMTYWSNDTQCLDVSEAESTNSEGDDPLVGDPSLGAGYDALSDWGTVEQVYCFSEGRKLLLGV